ncbi:MAG: hypothetical protein JO113_09695 [Candidatus Eremiobacteraeota bacterium]|nr:hypothetical protein [Candidatus Eremiobacteraeota bacterium]
MTCWNRLTGWLAFGACALIASCASPAQSPTIPSVARGVRASQPRSAAADLYVITWWHQRVLGYTDAGGTGWKEAIELEGLVSPRGLALDASGNVYVTDSYIDVVAVYAPGSAHPFATIQAPAGEHPYYVAVTAAGNIWTGNTTSSGGGELAEFSSNGTLMQTIACSEIKDYSGALAADAAGDLFVQSGSSQRKRVVEELPAGQTSCKSLPPAFSDPGGIAVTNSGDLVVADRQNYDAFTYAAPAFAKIVARTNFGGGNPHGASFAVDLSLTKANDQIWTANYPGPQHYGITLYRYPHGSSRRLAHIRTAYGAAIAVVAGY